MTICILEYLWLGCWKFSSLNMPSYPHHQREYVVEVPQVRSWNSWPSITWPATRYDTLTGRDEGYIGLFMNPSITIGLRLPNIFFPNGLIIHFIDKGAEVCGSFRFGCFQANSVCGVRTSSVLKTLCLVF